MLRGAQLKEYRANWASRYVCLERGLDVSKLDASASIVAPLQNLGWEPLFASPEVCNLNIVREFYMGLDVRHYHNDSIVSSIRGKSVSITPDLIATTLSVPLLNVVDFPVPQGFPPVPDETMAKEVLIDPTNFPLRTWKIFMLKIHYRILLRFVLANIAPRLRTSECYP